MFFVLSNYSMIFLRCLTDRITKLLRATCSWPDCCNDAVSIADKRGQGTSCTRHVTYLEQKSFFLKCMISFPPESLAGIMSCSTNSLPDLCRNIPPSTNPGNSHNSPTCPCHQGPKRLTCKEKIRIKQNKEYFHPSRSTAKMCFHMSTKV